METKIVFDIDDTICTNVRKLSYDNCVPVKEVIDKINYLHDVLNIKITLHTSRGMVSCNGDLEKIIIKNKETLEKWLEKYNVHYDEIIFGKPIADLYVDDKAMNVKDFVNESFCYLKGGSQKEILKLGSVVKKNLGDEKHTTRYKDWVEDNEDLCKYPKVISYLYNEVYIEFIDGVLLSSILTHLDLNYLLFKIECFERKKLNSFNVEKHIEILRENYSKDAEFNFIIDNCIIYLRANEKLLNENASFCHGDFILSNMIKSNKDGEIYFIDQNYDREASSYLLDLAKLKMSISGYEYMFGISKEKFSRYSQILDSYLKNKGIYKIVCYLTLMYICRLYRYKDDKDKIKVINFAKRLVKENEELFNFN